MILDTRDGDPQAVLNVIASTVDDWFVEQRSGLEIVTGPNDVARLAAAKILSVELSKRVRVVGVPGNAGGRRPRLQALIRLPQFPGLPPAEPEVAVEAFEEADLAGGALPSVPRDPYPAYVLFAPDARTPTVNEEALSGATLPGGYVGLVIRLNRDSARHWRGAGGTANISIPVPTVATLRFGLFQGRYERPRAEYFLEMRYVYPENDLRAAAASTNVMVYGFAKGETGHGDVRLVLPKPPAQEISDLVRRHQRPLPADGDVALLEWPTLISPAFRLTLLEARSPLFIRVANMLTDADNAHQLVGRGACWLPLGVSPAW